MSNTVDLCALCSGDTVIWREQKAKQVVCLPYFFIIDAIRIILL